MSAYLARLLRAVELGLIDRGSIATAEVAHDDWCDLLKNAGPCNCDPRVTVNTERGPVAVLADGNLARLQ